MTEAALTGALFIALTGALLSMFGVKTKGKR